VLTLYCTVVIVSAQAEEEGRKKNLQWTEVGWKKCKVVGCSLPRQISGHFIIKLLPRGPDHHSTLTFLFERRAPLLHFWLLTSCREYLPKQAWSL
jgi:hypothetical protein